MQKTKLSRRTFILRTPAAVAGLILLGSGLFRAAEAAPQKNNKPRPLGTCGGWSDKIGSGGCDWSEKSGGCKAENCPGHVDNSRRKRIAQKGAPKGVCAQWEDSKKKGFCEISTDNKKPCTYAACPANKNHA